MESLAPTGSDAIETMGDIHSTLETLQIQYRDDYSCIPVLSHACGVNNMGKLPMHGRMSGLLMAHTVVWTPKTVPKHLQATVELL